MKKFILPFVGLVLFSVALISWKNHTSKKAPDGAVVINDFNCGLLDGNGGFVITDNSQTVITPSGNGNLRCQATVPNSTGQAVVYNDLTCLVPGGGITTGRETVSASGQATLTCHVNGQ